MNKIVTTRKKSFLPFVFLGFYLPTLVSFVIFTIGMFDSRIDNGLIPFRTFILAFMGICFLGIPSLILGLTIIVMSKIGSDERVYICNVFCRYALIGPLLGLLLMFVAHKTSLGQALFQHAMGLSSTHIGHISCIIVLIMNAIGLARAISLNQKFKQRSI